MTKKIKSKAQSLTSMSAKTVLSHMHWQDNPTKFWFSMEEHMQQLIFPFLWQEYNDAQKIKGRVRAADLDLYTNGELNYTQMACEEEQNHARPEKHEECSPAVPADYESLDTCPSSVVVVDGRVDLKHDPYCLKHHFRSTWKLRLWQNKLRIRQPADIFWKSWNLYRESPSSPLEAHNDGYGDLALESRRVCLRSMISSQLLLYRLVAVFGMPASSAHIDSPKTAWAVVLTYGEEDEGYLAFEDCKGGAHVAFEGSFAASESAVQLIEWLVGDNVPHGQCHRLLGTAD